ncbi:RNA 2',3'-cyclic phosphodiesterase [Cereibacter sphaeroides]|uniref:RNA 2',3'-cyclic phosphodiesterase n=1 Tax=Cereibacter sphaeroides TaxID=1063 RepID=UPI001F3DF9F3|nr:RNA 2',3'-cyclic phosphodiesterase [Cereibacter sphaeroides]MCE6952147.1 RNA 2',3'-cyclic phosphodiesterase [Cereibacter sphaeroides]
MIRAFVAIDLPDEIRSALTLEQFLLPMPRKIEPENLHLTLAFLGEVSDEVLEAAHEGFAGITVPPFRIAIAGLGLFGGSRPRVVWAGVEAGDELARLQSKIDRAARVAGAEPDSRRFLPHVTLGRFAPPGPEERMRLERTVAERGAFRAGHFEVESYALYRSRLGAKGARYEELARYQLRR